VLKAKMGWEFDIQTHVLLVCEKLVFWLHNKGDCVCECVCDCVCDWWVQKSLLSSNGVEAGVDQAVSLNRNVRLVQNGQSDTTL